MNHSKFTYLITTVADHYGFAKQSIQTIEECSELIQALTKYYRALGFGYDTPVTPKDEENHIVEELADVYICVTQLCYLMGCGKQIEKIVEYKLNRQIERIKKEDEQNAD